MTIERIIQLGRIGKLKVAIGTHRFRTFNVEVFVQYFFRDFIDMRLRFKAVAGKPRARAELIRSVYAATGTATPIVDGSTYRYAILAEGYIVAIFFA